MKRVKVAEASRLCAKPKRLSAPPWKDMVRTRKAPSAFDFGRGVWERRRPRRHPSQEFNAYQTLQSHSKPLFKVAEAPRHCAKPKRLSSPPERRWHKHALGREWYGQEKHLQHLIPDEESGSADVPVGIQNKSSTHIKRFCLIHLYHRLSRRCRIRDVGIRITPLSAQRRDASTTL